jgi:hypothetical protein
MQPGRSSSIGKSENAPKMVTGGGARLSDDRVMQLLAAVAVRAGVQGGLPIDDPRWREPAPDMA